MTVPAPLPPDRLRELAIEAATTAAAAIRASRRHDVMTTKSTDTDIVTETDVEAEELIRAIVTRHTPGARLLGEEGGHVTAGTGPHGAIEWIVDPLDGTVNFAYRIPITAVSVAAAVDGRVVAGAVVDVMRDEVFSAHRGGGATRSATAGGAEPASVGSCDELSMALLATGFSYDAERRRQHGRTIAELLGHVRDVRGFGSAALHLCWVACGRLDAYVERDIKPWDYAAGSIIAAEAGATVELPCIENEHLVMACNPTLAAQLRPRLV